MGMRRGARLVGVPVVRAALAMLALGMGAGAAAAQEDEETYESPRYGYSLTYDAGAWEVVGEDEDEDDPYDVISLGNGASNVILIGDPGFEPDALADCLDGYVAELEEGAGFSDIAPRGEAGDEGEEGGEDGRAWTTVTFTYTADTGDEGDYVRYLECRAIGGGVTLVIVHSALDGDYEDQIPEREDLLAGLALPGDDPGRQDAAGDEDGDAGDRDNPNDAGIADGNWVGETADGGGFSLTVRDGGVTGVSYAYECDGEALVASASYSDPAPIEDGSFEFVVDTGPQTTVVTGTVSDGEAEGTLTRDTSEPGQCDVDLDWTAEAP